MLAYIKCSCVSLLTSGLFVLLASFASSVAALDYSREAPPVVINDARVSVGNRTVKLPEGEWEYLSYFKGRQSVLQGNVGIPWHLGYFAKSTGSKFDMGFSLTIAEGTNQMRRWDADPCKADGLLFKSELDKTFNFPDCILVNRRASHLLGEVSQFLVPAKSWLEKNK
jgi:hypothetical protein